MRLQSTLAKEDNERDTTGMVLCIFLEFSSTVTFPVFLFSILINMLLCQGSLWFIF